MEDINQYVAHFEENDDHVQRIQTVKEHALNVAELCKSLNKDNSLESIVYIIGLLHDTGKLGSPYISYMKKLMEGKNARRGEANHATAGGLIIAEAINTTRLTELLQNAIFSHHGLHDCVSDHGDFIFEKRAAIEYCQAYDIQLDIVKKRFFSFYDKDYFGILCKQVRQELLGLRETIKKTLSNVSDRNQNGEIHFYYGMYGRLFLSIVIDADRLDTIAFAEQKPYKEPLGETELTSLWDTCSENLETYLSKLSNKKEGSILDQYRKTISEECKQMALTDHSLYTLNVPTGSGKTLSSLRFALQHAKKYKKSHIIYVSPYISILEQNAQEIRNAIANDDIVLEHHCNVIHEVDCEHEKYEKLTENWDSPIIVTTAVQLLNTLYSSKISSVRRMHNITDAVWIIDEVQSLPIKTINLFNLAVNYFTMFCNSTIVLCSATQPIFHQFKENAMVHRYEMITSSERYTKYFERVDIVDKTKEKADNFSIEDLSEFTWEQYQKLRQVLVIVNTKSCARRVYLELKEQYAKDDVHLFHLSTNLIMINRKEKLKEMTALLEANKPVICVTTPLIEAGVDISFRCVIRSISGLDNLIQAAGRCNRNRKYDKGYVYLVKMSQKAESLAHLPEIKYAQEAMEELLIHYNRQPATYDNDLQSKKSIEQYYVLYYQKQRKLINYPINVNGISDNIVNLLSKNKVFLNQKNSSYNNKPHYLYQAYKTAGDYFEVIPPDSGFEVVIEYDEKVKEQWMQLDSNDCDIQTKKQILKFLQQYTVSISHYLQRELQQYICSVCEGFVFVLDRRYYSDDIGVCEHAQKLLDFLEF